MSTQRAATHTGVVLIPQFGVRPPLRVKAPLRETSLYWVSCKSGTKFRKTDGQSVGKNTTARPYLNLSTVEHL